METCLLPQLRPIRHSSVLCRIPVVAYESNFLQAAWQRHFMIMTLQRSVICFSISTH
jgi:hypothetical protein